MVKVARQEQERVLTILQVPLMSRKLAKKLAPLLQLIGGPGQVALQHAIVVPGQEQDYVLITLQAPTMTQKLTKKLATSKNAVMTLGQHGLHGIHASIVVQVHLRVGGTI